MKCTFSHLISRLWGLDISDAIFNFNLIHPKCDGRFNIIFVCVIFAMNVQMSTLNLFHKQNENHNRGSNQHGLPGPCCVSCHKNFVLPYVHFMITRSKFLFQGSTNQSHCIPSNFVHPFCGFIIVYHFWQQYWCKILFSLVFYFFS